MRLGHPRYGGVLLDWRGIIVHDPPLRWWVERSLAAAGRPLELDVVESLLAGMNEVEASPSFQHDELRVDTSLEVHRDVVMDRLRAAGFDPELAEVMYGLDFDPTAHPVYPDVPGTLAGIRERGCQVALVSDFHYDLRPEFVAEGIREYFDAFVISFEHGFQKPDPRMFATALEKLGLDPEDALMVGDRTSHDGGAAALGIDTLILPAPEEFGPRGLDVVLDLIG